MSEFMNKKFLAAFMISLLFVSLLYSCTLLARRPAGPVLSQLHPYEIYQHAWPDDMHYEGLERAVSQSIKYYERLDSDTRFQYGEFQYSPDEMIASLKLFLNVVNNSDRRDLPQKLENTFLFFESMNAEGGAFFTGYYEPTIEGSVERTEEFSEPLYRTPDDLIQVDLGKFSDEWKDRKIVGRIEQNQLVPYDSRDEIVYQHSLQERARPIVYVNEIELFFLQIQGSGLIRLRDGTLKRVNYAQKNGHPYVSIGPLLQERIPPGEISLQSIKSYLYDHPDEVRAILDQNQSYVFFRETAEGPLGNIEVPLTPGRSIAMDSRIVPKGGLAYIETELPVFENDRVAGWRTAGRFVLVQDTGGAIRDHGRVDLFLGSDRKAELTAGHLKNRGRVFVLVARKEYLQETPFLQVTRKN
jgi:membrane-bound lytic murein transglycosylase A